MKALAAKKLLWLSLGLLLLVNAIVLAKVFFNRLAVMETLVLSERELQLPYNHGFAQEDSSVRLSLRWAIPNTNAVTTERDSWSWNSYSNLSLSPAHFKSFKFAACDNRKNRRAKIMGWVLLELNGPSYRDYLTQVEEYQRLLQAAEAQASSEALNHKRQQAGALVADAQHKNTRLFAIDAAAERELLVTARQQRLATNSTTAAENLFILPAEIGAGYYNCETAHKAPTEIRVASLAVTSLYVPRALAQNFPRTQKTSDLLKFSAQIHYGRLWEPWVAMFQRQED
jgi:hypothetical protein